jgi:hypothetical protein
MKIWGHLGSPIKEFVEMTKDRVGYRAEGRRAVKSDEDYQLRERQASRLIYLTSSS